MAVEDYLQHYLTILNDERRETYEKHRKESEMLFEFIDWSDFLHRQLSRRIGTPFVAAGARSLA